MPSKAKTRAIELAAGRLAAATFDPQISAGREAIGLTRGNLTGTRAALSQFFKDSQSRYDQPVETKDLDASMDLMNRNRLAYSNNSVAAEQNNKLANYAALTQARLADRREAADTRRSMAQAREKALMEDNEIYYRNQMRDRQSAMDKLYGEKGALQAQTINQMMREQEQRDFQASEARRAREFQAQQNALQRAAQQAQADRQFGLSERQFKEQVRQFNRSSAAKASGAPTLNRTEIRDAQNLASTFIPRWLTKFGNDPRYRGPAGQQRLVDWMRSQARGGFRTDAGWGDSALKGILPGGAPPAWLKIGRKKDGNTVANYAQFTDPVFDYALQLAARGRRRR